MPWPRRRCQDAPGGLSPRLTRGNLASARKPKAVTGRRNFRIRSGNLPSAPAYGKYSANFQPQLLFSQNPLARVARPSVQIQLDVSGER